MGVREPKSKIEERFVECHMEMTAKKWLDSIEKQKRRIDLKKQSEKKTDGQTESTTKNNRLLARRGDQKESTASLVIRTIR